MKGITDASQKHLKTVIIIVVPIVLVASLLIQTAAFRRNKSATFDETFYLSCAQQTVYDRRLDKRLSQSGVGLIPIMLTHVTAQATYASVRDGDEKSGRTVRAAISARPNEWEGQIGDPPVLDRARFLNSLLLGVPLVLLVFVWLLIRRGPLAASLGGILTAFSPTIVAHSSLATTDVAFALFGMLAMAVVAWYFRKPGRWRFVCMSAAIGVALGAKYSSVFFFPVVFVLMLKAGFDKSDGTMLTRLRKALAGSAAKASLVLCISLFTLWGTCLFSFTGPLKFVPLSETPADSPWIKILGDGPMGKKVMDIAHENLKRPAPVAGMIARYLQNRDGHAAYLHGRFSRKGWWYYFPCAWVLKSTPAELLISLLMSVLLIFFRRKRNALSSDEEWQESTDANIPSQDFTFQVWTVSFFVFWLMVCMASVNIGQRYLIILYPLTILMFVDLFWRIEFKSLKPRLLMGVALVSVQVASCLWYAPNYLAYFTPLTGGPAEGRHYLLDSNLDWGQDLIGLNRALDQIDAKRPLLDYFGTALPEAYGIEADSLLEADIEQLQDYDFIAISVTHLQGLYIKDDPFAGFRELEPVARAGYSIHVYDLSSLAAKLALLQAIERIRQHEPIAVKD